MKYHLTEEQYHKIWTEWFDENESNYDSAYPEDVKNRKKLWRNRCKHKFKLTYNELDLINDHQPYISDEMSERPDFWGTITGTKKHINWFLLQL